MNYVIPKTQLRIFHKALQSLSKVGGEIYFEPKPDQLLAKTINSRKTAYFVFCFKSSFFSSIEGNIVQTAANPFRCKLQLKSILLAFQSVVNTEKTVESCIIEFRKDSYQVFITRNCRYQVCHKYTLPTLEHDTLRIDLDTNGNNHWTLHSKNLNEIMSIFRQNLDEVTMSVTKEGFQMRTYVYSHEEKDQVNTEETIEPEEFEEFHIEENVSLTFNLKELRSLMLFADATGLPVKATFTDGGQPITFSLFEEPVLEVTYVLATMPDENSDTIRLMNTPKPAAPRSRVIKQNGAENQNGGSFMQLDTLQRRQSTQNVSSADPNSSLPLPSMTPIPPPPIVIVHSAGDDSQPSSLSRPSHSNVLKGTDFIDEDTAEDVPNHNKDDLNTSRILDSRRSKKRKSSLFQHEKENQDESVIQSPPVLKPASKRPKLFGKCFEMTYNPALLQPGSKILAPDSDDEK